MTVATRHWVLLLALLTALALPLEGLAGGTLSVRLVRASSRIEGTDPALRDVAAALGTGFAFKGYALAGEMAQPLPAEGRVRRLGPYAVSCEGPPSALTIRVEQGRHRLIDTTARLAGGRPLILGGFQAGGGDVFLLVFIAR